MAQPEKSPSGGLVYSEAGLQASSNNRHLPVLDGLRGCAIIAVIVCHVNWAYGGPFADGPINSPVAMVFGWSWIGVDLFFVLSGFLITGILYDAKNCDGFFRNFYARRALRIFPLYFGFLFFIVLMNRLHSPFFPWLTFDDLMWLSSYTYNFYTGFTQRMIGGCHHFWSLAVEEHFYLLWPLAVWRLHRRPLMRLCLAVAAASFLLRVIVVESGWSGAAMVITPCRLDGLLAGSLAALARRDESDWAKLQRFAAPLALGSGCLLLGMALGQQHFLPYVEPWQVGHKATVNGNLVVTVGIAALAACFAGIIALAVNAHVGSRWRRLFEAGWLRTTGKYSYAIYVFHGLILHWTVQLLAPSLFSSPCVAKLVAIPTVLAASLVAAWLSYHLYEKHFLRLKRFFE